jgi:hypothetical protein
VVPVSVLCDEHPAAAATIPAGAVTAIKWLSFIADLVLLDRKRCHPAVSELMRNSGLSR